MTSPNQDAIDRFFAVALELLCIADTSGRFIRLNKSWEAILGYPIEELEGKLFLDFVHPDDMQATLDAINVLKDQQNISGFVNRYRHKDGTYRRIEWRTTPVGEQIYAVARDVTEKYDADQERERLLQELARKNEELERFTYTVSHDLKAPLITIQGFAKGMAEAMAINDFADANECLNRISNSARRMGEMLQDLLRLSRLGRTSNPFAAVDLNHVLKDTREALTGSISMFHVNFIVSPNLPTVHGDHTRLCELIQNLVENAIKFRQLEAPPIIEVGVQDSETQHHVYIKDNGIGIPPAHQKSIFGLFQKLNPKTDGTGIGLALVNRIAEMHKATVSVESEGKGFGCTFWVHFPKTGV